MLIIPVVLLTLLLGTAPVLAVSLSGILLYSTDDAGNPSGWDVPAGDYVHKQLWRTWRESIWNGLGVLDGLPPESLRQPPLNEPDFTIDIPLIAGVNTFTLVGEPSQTTASDIFARFAVNLYFDDKIEQPGISVLFARFAPAGGEFPSPNGSSRIFSLWLDPAPSSSASPTYDDGIVRVSVTAVSFIPSDSWLPADIVSPATVVPSGTDDWIGVLELTVEDINTAGLPPAPAPGVPVAPGAFGVIPGQRPGGGGTDGFPEQMGGAPLPAVPEPAPLEPFEVEPATAATPHGTGTTTPAATALTTASVSPGTVTPAATPSHATPPATTAGTQLAGSTPTPKATAGPATPLTSPGTPAATVQPTHR